MNQHCFHQPKDVDHTDNRFCCRCGKARTIMNAHKADCPIGAVECMQDRHAELEQRIRRK